ELLGVGPHRAHLDGDVDLRLVRLASGRLDGAAELVEAAVVLPRDLRADEANLRVSLGEAIAGRSARSLCSRRGRRRFRSGLDGRPRRVTDGIGAAGERQ